MSEHYPKGFLFLYTNGRVCVADGQGGQVPVNIPELIAERDALRAEIERLMAENTLLLGQRERVVGEVQP